MLREEIQRLLDREPFEPFRVKRVNADAHDVFDAQSVAVQRFVVSLNPADQDWILISIDKIASLESLIADYTGQLPK